MVNLDNTLSIPTKTNNCIAIALAIMDPHYYSTVDTFAVPNKRFCCSTRIPTLEVFFYLNDGKLQ